MNLKAIISDDEPGNIELIKLHLKEHCPFVNVIATYTSRVKAVNDTEKIQPDLLFLDIELAILNGFQLLGSILDPDFSIIFTTAYNQYALKAFRCNALDYLVKPVVPYQ